MALFRFVVILSVEPEAMKTYEEQGDKASGHI